MLCVKGIVFALFKEVPSFTAKWKSLGLEDEDLENGVCNKMKPVKKFFKGVVVFMLAIHLFGCSGKTGDFSDSHIPNYYEGNYFIYDEGAYYFRSQVDSYYLYKLDVFTYQRTLLAEAVPGYIYAVGEWIYFENLSDGSKLYRIKKDGTEMEKLLDDSIKQMCYVKGFFYFIAEKSLYSFHIVTREKKLLRSGGCEEMITNGNIICLKLMEKEEGDLTGEIAFAICDMTGKELAREEGQLFPVMFCGDYFYYFAENQLVRSSSLGTERRVVLDNAKKGDGLHAKIASGFLYYLDDRQLNCVDLRTGEDRAVGVFANEVQAFFLCRDKIIIKYAKRAGEEHLWYEYDPLGKEVFCLEGPEKEYPEIVTNLGSGSDVFPFEIKEEVRQNYLDEELQYEQGIPGEGYLLLRLPQIHSSVEGSEVMNRYLAERLKKEISVGKEMIGEAEGRNYTINGYYVHAGSEYIYISWRRELLEQGAVIERKWETLIFRIGTGERRRAEDFLCESGHEEKLAFAIYKELEKRVDKDRALGIFLSETKPWQMCLLHQISWNDFIFTEAGLVITYEHAFGSFVFFEIPYSYLENEKISHQLLQIHWQI